MLNEDDSTPAFPTCVINLDAEVVAEAMEEGSDEQVEEFMEKMGDVGLSHQQFFAAHALQGLLAHYGTKHGTPKERVQQALDIGQLMAEAGGSSEW